MHFLRTLVFSAVLGASAASAASIRMEIEFDVHGDRHISISQ